MSPSPQSFAIEVGDAADGGVEVRVRGELDMSTAPELSSTLLGAPGDPGASIRLDMSGVTFLDSSAIGAIIAAGQELAASGRKLRIGPRSDIVARVLEITGLTEGSDAFDVEPEGS